MDITCNAIAMAYAVHILSKYCPLHFVMASIPAPVILKKHNDSILGEPTEYSSLCDSWDDSIYRSHGLLLCGILTFLVSFQQ